MKSGHFFATALCACLLAHARGQQFQQIGPSQFWETDPAVNGVIIGQPGAQTAGVGLLVDGSALATPVNETFRTRVDAGNSQNWSMYRDVMEIGRIWHGTPATAFNVQVRQNTGNLWLRNSDGDGIRLNFNGVAGHPAQRLPVGYSLPRSRHVGVQR
jgi:hypothetical protein